MLRQNEITVFPVSIFALRKHYPMGLLNQDDPDKFEVLNQPSSTPVVLGCDHASKAIPISLNGLGLSDKARDNHIAWDIGAGAVTRRLSELLDATAILAGYSRLVIDLNRDPDDPASIPVKSDNIKIPGNKSLSAADRYSRKKEIYDPYHNQMAALLKTKRLNGVVPILFSIHSFTPTMSGESRPWHVGVLWNRDARIANPLVEALSLHPDNLVVGNNKPYSGRKFAHTLDVQAGAHGYANCALEIRQDLVHSGNQVQYWANLLAKILSGIFAQKNVSRIQHY